MSGLEQSDYHSQGDKESKARSGRNQDAPLRNSTHGCTTDTRYMIMTLGVLPLLHLQDLA